MWKYQNPITGKIDHYSRDLAYKAHDLTTDEFRKTREINDLGNYKETIHSLPLYQNLTINPMKVRETILHTKKDLSLVLVGDGEADQDIPVVLAA